MNNLFIMFIMSIFAGFLSSMNIWANNISDVYILQANDIYMVILMSGWMTLFMSILMKSYYGMIISLVIILTSLYMIRNQTLVDDTQFLKGMIPHHSMAILMSKKILNTTHNNEVKTLATNIIKSQESEILQMKQMLKTI